MCGNDRRFYVMAEMKEIPKVSYEKESDMALGILIHNIGSCRLIPLHYDNKTVSVYEVE